MLQEQISLAFPTLIGRFSCPDHETINAVLADRLLECEREQPSRDYANIGGWHSAGDLLEWPIAELQYLRNWISEAIQRMVIATGQLPEVLGRVPPPRGGFRISAWANISRRGHYHRLHNHPNHAWSGVYYVTSTSQQDSLAGVLEFYDPRPFTEMVEVPGSPYGQRMLIRPTPGLMVVFPSWLYHFVHPSNSDAARVSIAFNAAWRPT